MSVKFLDNVTKAISIAIHNEFGNTYPIYVDEIAQNFSKPAFVIHRLKTSEKQLYGIRYVEESTQYYNQRYEVIYPFTVMYLTTDKSTSDINEIEERLFDCLEYVSEVDGTLHRGYDMAGELTDNILYFDVKYKIYVYKQNIETELMETLEINERIGDV